MQNFELDIEDSIQRYLSRKMTEEQAMAFEDFFVDKPYLVAKIESSRTMMQGLHSMPSEQREAVANPKPASDGLFSRFTNWAWQPMPAYAVAASAIFALFALPVIQQPKPTTVSEFELINFSTSALRNSSDAVMLTLSDIDQAALIKVARVDYRLYEVQLSRPQTNDLVWQSEPFIFSALNDKLVMLPDIDAPLEVIMTLYGIDETGKKLKVKFCHYSERCLL